MMFSFASHQVNANSRAASRRTATSAIVLLVALLVVTAGSFAMVATSARAQDSTDPGTSTLPDRPDDPNVRVFDTAGILEDEDKESFEKDLIRANSLGVEILIYTRVAGDSEEQSQEFADRVRTEWAVETSDGADDGIVYVLTLPKAGAETGSVVMSTGSNTFPIRQLDAETLQRTLDSEMAPRAEDGAFLEVLYFGVRRVINYAEYSPPDPAPLTPRQETFDKVARVLSAMLVQLAILGYVIVPVIREGRFTLAPEVRSLVIYAVPLGLLGAIVGIIAIAGHSSWPSLASLAVVLWAAMGIPLIAGWLTRRREKTGTIHVRQRQPRIASAPSGHAHG